MPSGIAIGIYCNYEVFGMLHGVAGTLSRNNSFEEKMLETGSGVYTYRNYYDVTIFTS